MKPVWCHLHLPRLRSGGPDVISVKTPGRPIEYACWIGLKDAEFRVFEPGRQRCIREGVRNVHAWVVGQETGRQDGFHPHFSDPPSRLWRTAVYDPFKGGTFVDAEFLTPVLSASHVILSGKNVWYANEREL